MDANIQKLVEQQQAAQAAAAKAAQTAAFNAKVGSRADRAGRKPPAHSRTPERWFSGGGGSGGGGSGGGGGGVAVVGGVYCVVLAAPPPTAAGAAGAVQAAESQIGVPYVWAGEPEARRETRGFDCSGLVEWAYAQVGIGLPHFSGAQYADTTHIPFADIEPGDLLFYGPGGSDHVAMYVGGGSMIEAPYTGASVWITGVRTDFAGIGRVA